MFQLKSLHQLFTGTNWHKLRALPQQVLKLNAWASSIVVDLYTLPVLFCFFLTVACLDHFWDINAPGNCQFTALTRSVRIILVQVRRKSVASAQRYTVRK